MFQDILSGGGRLLEAWGERAIEAKYTNVAQPVAVSTETGGAPTVYREGEPKAALKDNRALWIAAGAAALVVVVVLLRK